MTINKVFNPYNERVAVRELRNFFGRRETIQEFYEAITNRQSTSLVGPRCIGKSSFLACLRRPEMQQQLGFDLHKYLLVLIDMRDFVKRTHIEFFANVCQEIVAQAQPVLSISMPAEEGEERFRLVLKRLEQAGLHPVLLIDGFDKVMANPQLDPNFLLFLRSQAIFGLVSYITASVRPLHEICPPEMSTSPFFIIFNNQQIGPFTTEEATAFMREPSIRAGLPFTAEEQAWIIEQAGRHPFFLQVTCHALFEEKRKVPVQRLNLSLVSKKVATELTPLFETLWREMKPEQQRELRRAVQDAQLDLKIFPELSESGQFRRWLRETSQQEQPELKAKDIKDALEHLDDEAFLQQCKLSTTTYVQVREQSALAAGKQKGWLVLELLKAAFECMKPGGARSDTAPEWRLYNVIYYRHFNKRKVNNDQLAARLEITSRRQFYREQERAINALLAEVVKLERASYKDGNA